MDAIIKGRCWRVDGGLWFLDTGNYGGGGEVILLVAFLCSMSGVAL